ncbi:TD and POZ domain-containing protein 3 [Araneus ventricosus]|uniref:TD and POZ domain-containing protein 3 n=1 Tax=Araneus ventricosus TaxID=182803 RepID=A0A4Y2S1Z6_ARAVE|nr:TD and POZ domain-containing protein 3 [Araneus ventricosus]
MDKYCQHQKTCKSGKSEYYFFTWSIPEVSLINDLNVSTEKFKMLNGNTYYASLCGSKDKITFSIASNAIKLKCFVSMIIGSKTLLLSNSLNLPTSTSVYSPRLPTYRYYNLVKLSSEDESFQKLKKHPNNTIAFICKIIYPGSVSTGSVQTSGNTSTDSLYNLRSLGAAFRNSSESSLKEKVLLRVDEETETVSKAVLCARSPVFAKMFENDMREVKENVVTVTDIKMPVLKVLISFLYTGKLSNCDFDSLCDIYYAADKYDVAGLRQICVDLLIPQISMENIHRVMKLAFSHNDELLKSTVMALIATNIETWFSTNEWINLLNDEPKIAAEVLIFFDF